MKQEKATAPIGIALKEAPPASVDAGAAFSVSALLTWPQTVAREGATFRVSEGKRTLQEASLPVSAADGSVLFTLRAPDEVGEHRLRLTVANSERAAERAEGALDFVLTTVPHETSLAVWDVPSPVVRNARFDVKAGAKCTSHCTLAGKVIEIRDESGELIGSGALGDATLPGTTALAFTTIALKAPRKLALNSWTASFAPSELKLPHGSAMSRFTFVTVAEPEHSVSVTVVNKATKTPIAGAQVRLGVYRAETDESGAAKVRVPKGAFPLVVTRPGYKMPERNIEVAKNVRVRIAAEQLPPEDPHALWTG
jgi:Carboxypeptidase regulatory-like domain